MAFKCQQYGTFSFSALSFYILISLTLTKFNFVTYLLLTYCKLPSISKPEVLLELTEMYCNVTAHYLWSFRGCLRVHWMIKSFQLPEKVLLKTFSDRETLCCCFLHGTFKSPPWYIQRTLKLTEICISLLPRLQKTKKSLQQIYTYHLQMYHIQLIKWHTLVLTTAKCLTFSTLL